jgi:hypothetical protein
MVINSWFNPINGNVYAAAGITGTRASQATLTSGHTITVNPGSPCLIPSPPPTYGVQTFDSALSTMTDLKNQVYTVTYNINTPVPSGTPTSSLTIKNKGSSSSYYVYSNPINVSGNMTLSNTNYVRFDGTVCVGGNLSISGDAHVIFNAGVKIDGQLTMTGGGGTVTFNDTLTAGSIDYANGMSLYLNNNVKVNGNVSFGTSGTTELKGTVYIGGNLSNTGARKLVSYKAMYINGNLSLTAGGYIEKSSDPPDATNKVIVVNGNITQSGGTTLGNINQYPLIINLTPGATITMNSGAKTNAALYAPSASVSLNGNAQFYGSLIAGSINLGNGSGSPGITWVSGLFSDITGGSSSGSGGSGGGSGGGTAYPAVEASRQIITWDIR